MTGPRGTQPLPGVGEAIEKFLGLPAPERILAELQRFNNNMEILQPDIHKLATALEKPDDIRNLTAALNKVNVGDAVRIVNSFTTLMQQIYERLWGKR